MRWVCVITVLSLVAGCSYTPAYEGSRCGPNRECPDGYVCVGEGEDAVCTSNAAQHEQPAGEEEPLPADLEGPDGGTGDEPAVEDEQQQFDEPPDDEDAGVADEDAGLADEMGEQPGGEDGGIPDEGPPADDQPTDEQPADEQPPCQDADGDGFTDIACGGTDCDDTRPEVNPSAKEGPFLDPTCGDGLDNDCDTTIDDADSDCQGQWWDRSFRYRRKITFDNHDRGAVQDFPVMVHFDTGTFDYSHAQGQGQDIRFVDQDDATVLDHEIEHFFEGSAGISTIWVKVPQIDGNSTEDFIWMYYGNGSASDAQNPAGVWGNGYQAVYHMNGNAADSTANVFDGVDDHGTEDARCAFSRCKHFTRSEGDYIYLGTDRNLLTSVHGWTISAVVKIDSAFDEGYVISISVPRSWDTDTSRAALGIVTSNSAILTYVIARSVEGFLDSGARDLYGNNIQLETGRFYHVTAVTNYETGMMSLWVDGEVAGIRTDADFPTNRSHAGSARNSSIGSQDSHSGNFFDGSIDELRISTVARSPDWIVLQARSQLGTLVQIGPEQALP